MKAVRAVTGGIRRGVEALEKVGEAAGKRLGGRFAENAAKQSALREGVAAARAEAAAFQGGTKKGVSATMHGEINAQPYKIATRSGVDTSGKGVRAINTPTGPVPAPLPEEVKHVLKPLDVPKLGSGEVVTRNADAEFKLFGHTILNTQDEATGQLFLGVTKPMCPSCFANLWNTRAALPGVQIINQLSIPTSGATGAIAPSFINRDNHLQ